ncbi:MAG TPA: helix-turn-helix domain-containing protein [Candidatus Dormibacteraeota bacterium]
MDGFGELLRRFRVAAGFSQAALAERAGLSTDAIAALERGRRSHPRPFTVALLADALRLHPAERAALVDASGPPARPPGEPGPAASPPIPLTTFVGREPELAELSRRLREARLVTLTGPGGTGKTRLAAELAASMDLGADGPAWFVALDACREPDLVAPAVAAAIGFREEPGRSPLETVVARLGGTEGMVVLDNCEHLLPAAASVAQALLVGCPSIRLLATSRAVLGLPGELTWRVPPLRLPSADGGLGVEALAGVEAVRLFVGRAALADPAFRLTEDNAAAVVGICRRLDGMPLALELAAARVRVLTPAQLLDRLEDAVGLLTGGVRTAMPRQQTLRATIEWSYELLAPGTRAAFDRLSVFSGGFDLEAAEAVSGAGVLEELASLVDQSLVIAEPAPTGTMRYRLLEVLRQFGQARLAARGEADTVRLRHAEHYLDVVRGLDAELRLRDRGEAVRRLRLEHANLQAALEWARSRSGDLMLRLATAMGRYWVLNGSITEGRTWLEVALGHGGGDPVLRATALLRAGRLANLACDYDGADRLLTASLVLKRDQRDQAGVARRLIALAMVALSRGDFERVRRLAADALEIMEGRDEGHGVAWAHMCLGWAALESGTRADAERSLREAERLHRALGNVPGVVYDVGGLTIVRIGGGALGEARVLVAEMIELVRRLEGMPEEPGWVWTSLVLAAAEGRSRSVARLAGVVRAMEGRGVPWNQALLGQFRQAIDQAWNELGAAEAERLAAEGAAMPLERIFEEALAESPR